MKSGGLTILMIVSSYMFVGSYNSGWTSYAAYGSSGKLEIELENTDGKSVGLGRRGNLIIGHVTMSRSRKVRLYPFIYMPF